MGKISRVEVVIMILVVELMKIKEGMREESEVSKVLLNWDGSQKS
jgi:hypothetical protein